eukprot:490456-Amphidinium_carterae.1
MLTESEVRRLLGIYAANQGGRPSPRDEPSAEQLSGLKHLLIHDQSPFVDFAIWGPDGKRQGRLLRFQAQIFVGGELVTKMIKGPPNIGSF